MNIYISSEPEEVLYKNELVVEIEIKHSEGVDLFVVGGFNKDSVESKSTLESLLLMLEDLDRSINPSPEGCYSHKKDFRNWFDFRLKDELNPIQWPESLLSKNSIVLKDYAIFYYDEYSRKYSALVELKGEFK